MAVDRARQIETIEKQLVRVESIFNYRNRYLNVSKFQEKQKKKSNDRDIDYTKPEKNVGIRVFPNFAGE